FRPFIDLIQADALTATSVGLAAATSATVTVLAGAVIGLYAATSQRMANRERRNYRTSDTARDTVSSQSRVGLPFSAELVLSLRRIPTFGGAGPLAWRQLVGARRHWGSLLMALIAPAA